MKLWLKLSFAAFAAFMVVGSLYATGRIGTYRVGRDIKELGLHPSKDGMDQSYRWSSKGYEPIQEYCERTIQPLHVFTGRIFKDAPHDSYDLFLIEIEKGIVVKPGPNEVIDQDLAKDLKIGSTQGIAKMLASSKAKWRVNSDDYKVIPPDNNRFSGIVSLTPDSLYGIEVVLEVEDNKITSVSRQFYVD